MRAALVALLVAAPGAAWAHPVDQGYLELRGRGEVVEAELDLPLPLALQLAQAPGADLTPQGIDRLAPALFAATLGSGRIQVDGQPCTWGAPVASVESMRLRLAAAARCPDAPGRLELTVPFVEQTGPTFRLLGRAQLDGLQRELSAAPGRETIVLEGPPPRGSIQLLRGLFRWLSPVGALMLLGLLGAGLGGRATTGALAGGWLAGALVGLAGFTLSARPVLIAALLAAAAPAVEALLATPRGARWRTTLPAGSLLGLALGPSLHGPLQALGAALGLASFTALALAFGLLARFPGLARGLAAVLLLATVAVGLLTLR